MDGGSSNVVDVVSMSIEVLMLLAHVYVAILPVELASVTPARMPSVRIVSVYLLVKERKKVCK